MTRGTALLVVIVAACEPAQPARPPERAPDTSWILSTKLDGDLQEFLLRAYDVDLVFPFRVRLASPLEPAEVEELAKQGVSLEGEGTERVARAQPRQLAALVGSDKVSAASCAPPPTERPADEGWRDKVDPDVRTVYAANSSCFVSVRVSFQGAVGLEVREALEALGARIHAFDARTAIAFVPVRGIPRVASLPAVSAVDPASRALEP